jgi:hypothetical protein
MNEKEIEIKQIPVIINRNEQGDFVCRLNVEHQCQFLGFRKFGQVPVCMKGEQHDLNSYKNKDYIEPDCNLAE